MTNLVLQKARPPPSLLKASPCSIVSGRGQFLFQVVMMLMIRIRMIRPTLSFCPIPWLTPWTVIIEHPPDQPYHRPRDRSHVRLTKPTSLLTQWPTLWFRPWPWLKPWPFENCDPIMRWFWFLIITLFREVVRPEFPPTMRWLRRWREEPQEKLLARVHGLRWWLKDLICQQIWEKYTWPVLSVIFWPHVNRNWMLKGKISVQHRY